VALSSTATSTSVISLHLARRDPVRRSCSCTGAAALVGVTQTIGRTIRSLTSIGTSALMCFYTLGANVAEPADHPWICMGPVCGRHGGRGGAVILGVTRCARSFALEAAADGLTVARGRAAASGR
jgi:hypothetical protein